MANAEGLVKEWLGFFQYLFVKYMVRAIAMRLPVKIAHSTQRRSS